MPDRLRRGGVVGVIVMLLGVVMAGLVFGSGRPTDRAYELEQRLRCPVCKSVSIAESMSDTALAMRTTVEEQIEAGRSDEEIIAYFTDRYGRWVLLDPPTRGDTLLLWLIPLGVAAAGVALVITRRRAAVEPTALSDADRERVLEAVTRMRATAEEEDPAVTGERERLEQECDQALRDLVDLERQLADGELPAEVAAELQAGYERTAAAALARLSDPADGTDASATTADRPSSRARWSAYGLALAVAVFAAVVLLPVNLGERPTGGAVTGNEALGPAAPTQGQDAGARDLSTVTNEELEDVVTQNPEVIDMRLALAHRYLDEADYLAAARHYLVALDRAPRSVEAQAHYGWLLMQLDEPEQAAEYVDGALAQDPRDEEALWFKANIALYGLADPAGAATVLEQLQQRPDLPAEVRTQVDALIAEARGQKDSG